MKCPTCGEDTHSWGAALWCDTCDGEPGGESFGLYDPAWYAEPSAVLMLRPNGEVMGVATTKARALAVAESWEELERCRHCGELQEVFEFVPCELQIPWWGLDGEPISKQPEIVWDPDRACYARIPHPACIVCRGDVDNDQCPACHGEFIETEGIDNEWDPGFAGRNPGLEPP